MYRFYISILLVCLTYSIAKANDSTYFIREINLEVPLMALDFNKRGNLLAAAGRGGEVHLLQPALGTEVKKLRGVHTDDVLAVTFSPDGRLLASGGVDKRIVIWDVASGQPIRVMDDNPDHIRDLDFSPDGEILASAGWDGTVVFWETGTGRRLRKTEQLAGNLTSVSFGPNGRRFVAGCSDSKLRIYDSESMELQRTLEGHADDILDAEWSDRSGLIASCGWDNTALVWNHSAGRSIRKLPGHDTDVTSVSFSPDGTVLATSGGDRRIKLWDIPTGKEIVNLTLHAHDSDVEKIDFNQSGSTLASCSRDGKVKIWRVPSLEDRLAVAIETGMDQWMERGPYERTADYEKRMNRSEKHADELRKELEKELAVFFEENVNWQEGITFRTYNPDGGYFPLTSPLFGSLKVMVDTDDAPRVAESLDNIEFRDLNIRVRNGKMEIRRINAYVKGSNRRYPVVIL